MITEKAKPTLGFGGEKESAEADYEATKAKVVGELKDVFRPELINRIDEIIVFRKLTQDEIKQIAGIMLSSLKKRMAELGHNVVFTDALVDHLADAGYDDVYGARPLRRAIQSEVEDYLADCILGGEMQGKDEIIVDFKNSKVILG